MDSMQKANATNLYVILTVATIVGTVGVFFRFLDEVFGHGFIFTSVSNIILVIGILIALKGVFAILAAK
ncbi:hypothetical protein LLH06_05000 [Mucilaginibacter daejeonensis]|uniref:hypothetical protein n=1 Tax=Mucilaginibacter daejeonensis TaxID=398049 RepID=UPI001D172673|nr:hypothetical protein [Mucilaginibacter daejeonensis]UEG54323.1 hypothetical protein LLH06_05000 [Mucilaginibacter daejeonensis]